MHEARHYREANRDWQRVIRRSRLSSDGVTIALWTPLTPLEIAKELRPFLLGQSPRRDTGPKLQGRLGSRSMTIQRVQRHYHRYDLDFPRCYVEYESVTDGTLLIGMLKLSTQDRATIVAGGLFAVAVVLLVLHLFGPLISLATTLISAGVLLGHVMAYRARDRFVLPWYQRLLMDVLMAEDVGGDG